MSSEKIVIPDTSALMRGAELILSPAKNGTCCVISSLVVSRLKIISREHENKKTRKLARSVAFKIKTLRLESGDFREPGFKLVHCNRQVRAYIPESDFYGLDRESYPSLLIALARYLQVSNPGSRVVIVTESKSIRYLGRQHRVEIQSCEGFIAEMGEKDIKTRKDRYRNTRRIRRAKATKTIKAL